MEKNRVASSWEHNIVVVVLLDKATIVHSGRYFDFIKKTWEMRCMDMIAEFSNTCYMSMLWYRILYVFEHTDLRMCVFCKSYFTLEK